MPEGRRTDVDVSRIFQLGAGLAGIVAVVAVLVQLSLGAIARRPFAGESRRSPLARETPPPEPRLQTSPAGDMEAMRARDRARLQTYGWVDRAHGVVRVPVEEAKKIVLRKGLPSR
jgi:hypothetical protein